MKKYPRHFFGLLALVTIGGCASPKVQNFKVPEPKKDVVSDPDLTLIKKEIPKYYSFPFERGNLYFSTNGSQQTHAILTRHLCPDAIEIFQKIPVGKTMKQNEWNGYLKTDVACSVTGRTHFNNWQKFYQ